MRCHLNKQGDEFKTKKRGRGGGGERERERERTMITSKSESEAERMRKTEEIVISRFEDKMKSHLFLLLKWCNCCKKKLRIRSIPSLRLKTLRSKFNQFSSIIIGILSFQ
jgi:hypothetical protein